MSARISTIALVLLAPLASGALTRAPGRQADDGKTLYDQNCMQCHGARGTAPKTIKATLPNIVTFNAAFAASHTADSIVKILTHGKSTDMPSFKGKLTPQQMTTVAKYVLALASK